VLPPVRWRCRLLADGGIADNTPIWHAVALGARPIYVLRTQNPGNLGLPRPPRAALAVAVHAITVLTNARLHGDLARYAQSAELIVLPAANPGHIPPTGFGHADQLITPTLAAARTALTVRSARSADGGHSPAGISPGRTGRPGDPCGEDPRPVREPSGPRPRAGPGTGPAAAAPGLEACCRLAAIAAIEDSRAPEHVILR
jgi:hypothetical protein